MERASDGGITARDGHLIVPVDSDPHVTYRSAVTDGPRGGARDCLHPGRTGRRRHGHGMQIGEQRDLDRIWRGRCPGWVRRIGQAVERLGPLLFVLVAAVPLLRRLRHPTLQGDDITRLVDLIEKPFRRIDFSARGANTSRRCSSWCRG